MHHTWAIVQPAHQACCRILTARGKFDAHGRCRGRLFHAEPEHGYITQIEHDALDPGDDLLTEAQWLIERQGDNWTRGEGN